MIKITIETDNAAFQDGGFDTEVSNILRGVARRFEIGAVAPGEFVPLRDSNGNTIGGVSRTREVRSRTRTTATAGKGRSR